MTVQFTFVGMGRINTSIGLALAQRKEMLRRAGHDRDPQVSKQAEKMGALDSIEYNLPSAVRKSDVVVVDVPVDELKDTLALICQDLKPGAVLMETSPIKTTVAEWMKDMLPADRHYIGLYPTMNPVYLHEADNGAESAHADLFQQGLMVITHPEGATSEAIKLATDLTSLLGADPYFSDPEEADGLLTADHLLPQLLAVALVNATVDQPGWREGRKLAGSTYARVSGTASDSIKADGLSHSLIHNRQNSLRVLDNAIAALQSIRTDLDAGDEANLTLRIERALKSRNDWWRERLENKYAQEGALKMEAPENPFSRLFGVGLRRDRTDRK